MGVIPQDLAKHNSPFLKGEAFDGEGINLRVVGFEIVKANDPEYGANETSFLFKSGKLKEGETCKYSFTTVADKPDVESFEEERTYETTSPGFFIAFSNLNPDAGDVVNIRREGKAAKTRYFITKIS